MEEQDRNSAADSTSRTGRTSGARGRISRRLVITSSAAILAVYAVGFARTQAAADRVSAATSQFQASQANPPAAPAMPTVPPNTSSSEANSAAAAPTQAPAPAATTAPTAATQYRDGTYSATGVSRHGDIAAQVTVKGGKIVSTQITGCYTRYPCSRISDLTEQVVSQQSTDVDMVSGATDSSEAFLQAVDNALQKALG